jgi:tetratricopeptide (TPR) repeat protein
LLAEYEMGHGQDPRSTLGLAISSYDKAVQLISNNYGSYNSLANAYAVRGDYEYSRGIDPTESWKNAIAAYQKALEINPNYTHAFNNIGTVHEAIGKYELATGKDPSASFLEAEKYYHQTMKLNPKYQHPYINLGITLRYLAEYEMSQGRDPSETLRRAEDSNQKALEISHDSVDDCARADIHLWKARYELLKRRSPEKELTQAQIFLERAKQNDGTHAPAYTMLGTGQLIQAKWQNIQRKPFEWNVELAKKDLLKAAELNPLDPEPTLKLAECQLLIGDFDSGLKSIEQSLSLNPNLGEAHAIRGLLLLKKNEREKAQTAIKQALTLNKNLSYLYGEYLTQGEGR